MLGPTLHSSSQSIRVHSQRCLAIWHLEMDWHVLYMAVDTRPEILDSARCGWNAITLATALLLPVSGCGEAAGDSTGGSTGEPDWEMGDIGRELHAAGCKMARRYVPAHSAALLVLTRGTSRPVAPPMLTLSGCTQTVSGCTLKLYRPPTCYV